MQIAQYSCIPVANLKKKYYGRPQPTGTFSSWKIHKTWAKQQLQHLGHFGDTLKPHNN